jgi:hypothetical protein
MKKMPMASANLESVNFNNNFNRYHDGSNQHFKTSIIHSISRFSVIVYLVGKASNFSVVVRPFHAVD